MWMREGLPQDKSRARRSYAPSSWLRPGVRRWRLGHLPVYQGGLIDDPGLFHLEPEVIPLARAFAYAGEHGKPPVVGSDSVDHFHDDHRFPHARAAKKSDLPPADIWFQEIDDLD